jgi:hypothetical protein
MIEWLLMPGNQLPLLRTLLGRAWRGGAQARVLQPTDRSREITVLIPEDAQALRQARFPDVLTDWVDIYEEPLFPSPRAPVAGEVLSEQGDDCLALHADLGAPGGARGGIAWYEKGALVELEQVGKAAVAWRRGEALGRPSAVGVKAQLASLAGRMADTERDAGLYERVEAGLSATTEAVLGRALLRLLGDDPPPLNELARAVLAAPGARLQL